MTAFKGNISPIEIKTIKNYEDTRLGPCWITKESKTIWKGKTLIQHWGTREIIVPTNDGELADRLASWIKSAKQEVYISSFLVEKGVVTDALMEASKNGVMTVLITARESELSLSEDDLDELQESRKAAIEGHKKLLDSLAGKVLVRTSPSFHAKYVIIDPFSTPKGILMTCNATNDAMNGNNIELAVTLLPEEVRSLFHHFLHGFWDLAGYELLDKEKGSLEPVKKETVEVAYGPITLPVTWGSTKTLKSTVLDIVNNAKKNLIISAWSFEKDGDAIKAIGEAMDRGVQVEILCRFAPKYAKNTGALLPLASKGAIILGHRRFHAKLIVADEIDGLIMTSNLTNLGLDQGFEAGLRISGKNAELLSSLMRSLSYTCEYSLDIDMHTAKAPEIVQKYVEDTKPCLEIFIKEAVSKQLPEKLFASCTDMLSYQIPESDFPKNGDRNIYARKAELHQIIKPPVLPKEAKLKEMKDVPFPVYGTGKNGKNNYIVVKRWEDIELIRSYIDNLKAKVVVA